jgi:hypothetical protein
MDGFEWTVTGGQLLVLLGVLLVVVLVAVAGRVLLAAAVIVAAQWVVITYWPGNTEQPRVFRTGFLLVLCYFLAVQPSVVNFLRRAVSES